MIKLINASHISQTDRMPLGVLSEVNFVFDQPRMGLAVDSNLLAERLLDLLVGYIRPKQGRIVRQGRISWPIGRVVQLRSTLTGRMTINFLCDLYNLNPRQAFDEAFSVMDFGNLIDHPVIEWPRDKVLELAYTTALLPNFTIYVVEGTINTTDDAFMARWSAKFESRLADAMLIYYSNSETYMSRYVDRAVALVRGSLVAAKSVAEAFELIGPRGTEIYSERLAPADFVHGEDL